MKNRRFIDYISKNKAARYVIEIVILLVYSALFCALFFSKTFMLSEKTLDDYALKSGKYNTSDQIVVIGITQEDLDTYDCQPSELINRLVKKLNTSGNDPAAIGLDVSVDILKDDEDIIELAKKYDNVILPIDIRLAKDTTIDNLDIVSKGIVVEEAEYLDATNNNSGHTVKIYDSNGTIRHAILDIDDQDNTYSSMPYLCYKKYCQANGIELKEHNLSQQNTALIRFSEEQLGYDHSATDVLTNKHKKTELANKIVYIGFFDTALENSHLISIDYSRSLYSVEIDSNITNCLINNKLILNIPLIIQIVILFLAIVMVAIFTTFDTTLASTCFLGVYELGILVVLNILNGFGYIGYSLPHIINGIVTGGICIALRYVTSVTIENEELVSILGRYVDVKIAKDLVKTNNESIITVRNEKNVKTSKVTVLFADVRGFTSISEKMEPNRLVKMLNELLSMMAVCITKYNGTVDKFIGDCAMGYWSDDNEDSIYNACNAAYEIQKRCRTLRKNIYEKYGYNIKIGIGMAYGEAIIGNVGSLDRMNYTVVGDTVNIASRLEKIAPADEIYVSSNIAKEMNKRGIFEKIPEMINLKGKQKPQSVFRLVEVFASNDKKEAVIQDEKQQAKNRKIASLAILTNLIIFMIQFVFTVNSMRELGINNVIYGDISLAIFSAIAMILLLPDDLRFYNNADQQHSRPRWLNILMLSSLIANIYIFNMYVVSYFFVDDALYVGFPIYFICPLLCTISFFFLEKQEKYSLTDFIFALSFVVAIIVTSMALCFHLELDIIYPTVFKAFYSISGILIILAVTMLIVLILFKLFFNSKFVEIVRKYDFNLFNNFNKSFKKTKFYDFYSKHDNFDIVNILANILIGVLSARTIITAYKTGGVALYSNPSLIGMIVILMCLISIYHFIVDMIDPDKAETHRWYKYVSFIKTFGNLINFFTILFIAMSGEGFRVFFVPRWSADWTIFLLCPCIACVTWINEKNDYGILKCVLVSIPYMLILPISKLAINSTMADRSYAYEVSNFYKTPAMVVIIIAEIFLAIVLCYLSRLIAKIFIISGENSGKINVSVCGTRRTFANDIESIYGCHSECYVIKNKDYALVINAGSGLLNAKAKLEDCNEVDILLCSSDFSCLIGLLSLNKICPKASVRIFSPFPIDKIATKPYWPVNVIKSRYEEVKQGKKVRLNNFYDVTYYNADENDYIVKITGIANICYAGRVTETNFELRDLAANSDLLIYDYQSNHDEGSYLAIDANISHLLFSGYENESDQDIQASNDQLERLRYNISFAKENDEFILK